MNSQPISLIRGHDSVVPVRIELGYAPLDLSTATAATFTAKPGELSTVVKITKTLGSGVTAGLLGLANISFSVADMAELDVSNSYTWSLTATVGGVASIVARGVLTAIGEPQQFVDEGVDQVARDLAASKASPEQVAASTAAHNASQTAHGVLVSRLRFGRKALVVGDSTAVAGAWSVSVAGSAVSGSGNLITISVTLHQLWPGAKCYIIGAMDSRFNGSFIVNSCSSGVITLLATALFPEPKTDSSPLVQIINDGIATDRNFVGIASALSRSPITDVVVRALNGSKTSTHVNILKSVIAEENPDLVVHLGVTNDLRADVSADIICKNVVEMASVARSAGAGFIACTHTPFDSRSSGYTSARRYEGMRYNNLIRMAAIANNFGLLDVYSICSDPTSATGNWKSGYGLADAVHGSAKAYQRIANDNDIGLSRFLDNPLNAIPFYAMPGGDVFTSSRSIDYCRNGAMLGTTGLILGTVTGLAPESWTITNSSGHSVASSLVANSKGGYSWVWTLGGSGTSEVTALGADCSSLVASGGVFLLLGCVEVDSMAGLSLIKLFADLRIAGVDYVPAALANSGTNPFGDGGKYNIVSRPIHVPAGATLLRPRFTVSAASSSSVVKLSSVSLLKIG